MHENKNNRWDKWNYSWNGFYFITICTKDRYPYFGIIENNEMVLNEIGNIIKNEIENTKTIHNEIKINEYCIMPNHIHFIIQINDANNTNNANGVGVRRALHLHHGNGSLKYKINRMHELLPIVIGSFKSSSTKQINRIKPYYFKWQRSFHDHIIRNEPEYLKIKYYIQNNPKMWNRDRNNI